MKPDLLSTTEAAAALGLSKAQVCRLIAEGHLPATQVGRSWVIRRADLARADKRPRVGRPKGQA